MGALNAFTTTWAAARGTFGAGTPVDGSQLDGRAARTGQETTESAARPREWSGTASTAYAAATTAHAAQLGTFSDLDRRLGAEIAQSADVVAAGRRDLETVRQWVVDAAATVPNTAAGQQLLWSIVNKGVGEVHGVMTRADAEQSEIAERVRALGDEYDLLGTDGKGGIALDKPDVPSTPPTTLDLDDIEYRGPDELGPSDHAEIGPGTWVPNYQRPGVVPNPPKAPLDYRDIVYTGPKGASPGRGYMQLVPGSGAWVPDPNSAGFVPHPPRVPVDMATGVVLGDGELAPAGMIPIYPGARIAIPDPDLGRPR